MTKRYFYDCPLKAAYMAKHHGMQLVCCYQAEDDGLEYASDDSYPFSDAGIDAEMWGDIVKAECRRVYIHPDSLALLEPEGTDLCKVAYDGDFGRSEAVENWGYSLLSGRRPGLRVNYYFAEKRQTLPSPRERGRLRALQECPSVHTIPYRS
jgi:hypothetical protein